MEEGTIDIFDAATIMFAIMAFASDLSFVGMLGLVIPGVGLAIAMFILVGHYLFGLIILMYFIGKSHGWLAKVIIVLAWLLPLPTLTAGVVLAIVASNKIGAFIIETVGTQVVIQGIALATGGAGEALEGGAVIAEGGEAVVGGGEAIAAGGEMIAGGAEMVSAGGEAVGEGATAIGETGEALGQEGELVGEGGGNALDEMASREEGNPMENLQEELNEPREDQFGEQAEAEGGENESEGPEKEEGRSEKLKKKIEKVTDILDRTNGSSRKDDEDDEEGDAGGENLEDAA